MTKVLISTKGEQVKLVNEHLFEPNKKYEIDGISYICLETFTHTEEGKDILNTLSNIISTHGMEVYKCWHCDELFAGRPEESMYDGKPECGMCSDELNVIRRDSHGLENCIEEDEE